MQLLSTLIPSTNEERIVLVVLAFIFVTWSTIHNYRNRNK